MKLSILVPVYNEQRYVKKILQKVSFVKLGKWQKELIIIDDGSKDKSVEIIKDLLPKIKKKFKKIHLIVRKKNGGKGAAIKDGLKQISGDVVITQDSDLEYDPNEWPSILEKYEETQADLVFGYRHIDFQRPGYFMVALGVKVSTHLLNLLYGSRISDIYTCYKLTKVSALKTITYHSNSFEIDIEIVCKLLKRGGRAQEVPISYYPRSVSEGKKITIKHGLIGLWTIVKNRFV